MTNTRHPMPQRLEDAEIKEYLGILKKINFQKSYAKIVTLGFVISTMLYVSRYIKFQELREELNKQKHSVTQIVCEENYKSEGGEDLEMIAKRIMDQNSELVGTLEEVTDYLRRTNPKGDNQVEKREDLVLPIYSKDICAREKL